jgi:hypothetical protein
MFMVPTTRTQGFYHPIHNQTRPPHPHWSSPTDRGTQEGAPGPPPQRLPIMGHQALQPPHPTTHPPTPTHQPPTHTPNPPPTITTAPTKHKATVSLPYHRGTSEIISRAFRKADVGVVTSNKNPLRTQLIHLKDPIPHTHKSSVVYHIPCAGSVNKPCAVTYIGETERSMDTRFREHHNKAKSSIRPPLASTLPPWGNMHASPATTSAPTT